MKQNEVKKVFGGKKWTELKKKFELKKKSGEPGKGNGGERGGGENGGEESGGGENEGEREGEREREYRTVVAACHTASPIFL